VTAAGAAFALAASVRRRGRGLLRLARLDAHWRQDFDVSLAGFLLSFLARLVGLPFYLVSAANLNRGLSAIQAATPSPLWPEAVGFLINMLAYPLLIALLARPLKATRGYTSFVVVINWASLFLTVLLSVASLLALGGEGGLQVFGLAWILLAGAALYLTWRAAQETLVDELAPILLVVMLWVTVDVGADQLVALIAGALGAA
jgi:hypothetical protein